MPRRQKLRLVPPRPACPTPAPRMGKHILPRGVPPGASCLCVRAADPHPEFGARPGDDCLVWIGAPLTNYDFAYVLAGDGTSMLGRYHAGPGGYVKLVRGEDDEATLAPSEVKEIGRVMHTERDGEIVREYPLGKGGAR